MSSKLHRIALVAAAGVCAPAFAQDSVSNTGAGLPGDALSPYDTATQCASYVTDLVPFTTSKGTPFGVAPVLKSPRVQATFYNNLLSAQSISPDILDGVASASGSYALWTTPGAGVNPTTNNAPGSIAGPNSTSQFALGFADFGGAYNGIVGAVVNVDPANPARLFVTRRQTATNGVTSANNFAQTGYGAIDANGNQYYRVDDFGTSGGSFPAVTGNNLYRTRLLDRTCNVLNVLSGSPASFDATDAFDTGFGDVLVAPNMGPASIFGGNGIVATSTFSNEFAYGTGGATTKTTTTLAGTATRGALGFSSFNLLGGSGVATYGQLNQDAASFTRLVSVWEVDGSGNPLTTASFAFPASVTDNETGVTVTGSGTWQLGNYQSQAPFRGGAGQVALTRDPATGLTLVAAERDFATPSAGSDPAFPLNDIVVARHNPATGVTEYTLAAYIDPTSTVGGKGICDANGMFIGRLEELFDVTGGSPIGPSMSSPAFDSAGNIWFTASAGLFDAPVADAAQGNVVDFDTILIRAIYDPANFSYTLEKVLEPGDIFVGANSGTEWQITFMGIADSNSINSSAFFSGNVAEEPFGGLTYANLDPADPLTNGGVVLNAQITYDVDGDGDFEDSSAGNPGIDEEYQVLLYIGNLTPVATQSPCDCDGSGTLSIDDIDCFVAAFLGGSLDADCDGSGGLSIDDIDCFVACFLAGL